MKFLTAILATLLLFMTVQPALLPCVNNNETETCSDSSSCSKSCSDDEDDNDYDCCHKGCCNPFLACACCFYVITNQYSIQAKYFSSKRDKIQLHNESFISNYSHDILHPPEFV